MGDLDESYDELYLHKRKIDGSYVYKGYHNNLFNDKGIRISSTKFETLFEGESKQQKEIEQKVKETKETKETEQKVKQAKEEMSSQVMDCAHQYTDGILNILLEKFEGKVVGSDDFNHEKVMKELFGDYKPGDKGVKKKEKKPKKKKPLSGYTYYGKVNKEKINQMIKDVGDNQNFLSVASGEWKKLSKEEKDEWSEKAKVAFEEENGMANDE